MCKGFFTHGLMHVSKYCNKLRTFCLKKRNRIEVKDAIWLHQLASNSTVLERFHVTDTDISEEDVTLLAKNCCKSLLSLKIGACYLSKLGDAFRYAVRLEHFGGGYICDGVSELVGFEFPQTMCSISMEDLPVTRCVHPFLNQIKILKLTDCKCQCLLFKRCPNLEVLYTKDICGDRGLQVISQFCKKLRKLSHKGFVNHVGFISLAKGCTNLESLDVTFDYISYETLDCVGIYLKNLRDFRIWLSKKDGITTPPLDYGVRAMLMGCNKLERLHIYHCWHGGLTDVGLEYIEKYGANLRSLSLTRIGNSNAGLLKLSQGCPKLRKLKLIGCPFSEEVVTSCVFNIQSLRYVLVDNRDGTLALIRPEFQV